MIQDIGSHRLNIDHYAIRKPQEQDKLYLFHKRDVLRGRDGTLPRYGDVKGIGGIQYRYLFDLDGQPRFLGLTEQTVELEAFHYQLARDFRYEACPQEALAGFTAIHLNSWYQANQFCGRCGSPLVMGEDERKMVCPRCGNLIYPRINPAIIVAVTDGDRLLMTKYSGKTHTVHHYVLIAGFVEIGETAEQTVAREVVEEVGVHVKNIRYFGSQPWGCDGNLTLGYFADLDGDAHITLDHYELSDGHWFQRAEVPVPADNASITAQMIRTFAAGKEPK